ncbi:hypothetical protein MMC07_004450 [Pseudocyphellaria aurata]|nr:hypothetical protein [Pseudocyphellaria aurata]
MSFGPTVLESPSDNGGGSRAVVDTPCLGTIAARRWQYDLGKEEKCDEGIVAYLWTLARKADMPPQRTVCEKLSDDRKSYGTAADSLPSHCKRKPLLASQAADGCSLVADRRQTDSSCGEEDGHYDKNYLTNALRQMGWNTQEADEGRSDKVTTTARPQRPESIRRITRTGSLFTLSRTGTSQTVRHPPAPPQLGGWPGKQRREDEGRSHTVLSGPNLQHRRTDKH